MRERLVLIGEAGPWRVPEPRALQQVTADTGLRQRCEQVFVALDADLAVALGGRGTVIGAIVGAAIELFMISRRGRASVA